MTVPVFVWEVAFGSLPGDDVFHWTDNQNLVTNSSFETDTSGWVAFNCTLTRDTLDTPPYGTHEAKAVSSAAGASSIQFAGIAVEVGKFYSLSASLFRHSGSRTARVRIAWLNAVGAAISTTGGAFSTISASGSWTRVELPAQQAPDGAVTATVIVQFNTGASGNTMLVDGVLFEHGFECSDYDDAPDVFYGTDISLDVGQNAYTRGKNGDLDRTETGTGALELLDDLNNYDPRNTEGPYYPFVRPVVPIRQSAVLAGTIYPLCQHFVERWPRTRLGGYVTRQVATMDAFEGFARAALAGLDIAEDTTGVHVGSVLDYIGWPAGRRLISSGSATVAAVSFADTDTSKALGYLQDMEFNEGGFFFIDGSGDAVFLDRTDLRAPPFDTIQAYFTDNPADGNIPYESSVPTSDIDLLFNDWSGTRAGGTVQTASDSDSIGKYRPRAKQVTLRLNDDAQVLAFVQAQLAFYKDPHERLSAITVRAGESTKLWRTLLTLDVGDRVAVTETPLVGPSRTEEYLIQRVTLQRAPGSDSGAVFTFALFPAVADVGAVIFDDPVYDRFDENKIGW